MWQYNTSFPKPGEGIHPAPSPAGITAEVIWVTGITSSRAETTSRKEIQPKGCGQSWLCVYCNAKMQSWLCIYCNSKVQSWVCICCNAGCRAGCTFIAMQGGFGFKFLLKCCLQTAPRTPKHQFLCFAH